MEVLKNCVSTTCLWVTLCVCGLHMAVSSSLVYSRWIWGTARSARRKGSMSPKKWALMCLGGRQDVRGRDPELFLSTHNQLTHT